MQCSQLIAVLLPFIRASRAAVAKTHVANLGLSRNPQPQNFHTKNGSAAKCGEKESGVQWQMPSLVAGRNFRKRRLECSMGARVRRRGTKERGEAKREKRPNRFSALGWIGKH